MSITVSGASSSFQPVLVLGWESSTESRNVYHRIVGRTSMDVTLREDDLQSGPLKFLFATRETAVAARDLLRSPAVFSIVDTDRPELDMSFTRVGRMTLLQLDDRTYWELQVEVQEVDP